MAHQDPNTTAAIRSLEELTLDTHTAKAKEEYDQLFNVTLDIGVTGETGAGKSAFVNAIRGLSDDDDGAAPTGVTETTMEPTMYLHPTMPNIRIWDLPGIGSQTFKAKQYIKDVELKKYDFFIIISSGRFKENDIMLAKEIKRENKLFYFVRSKIDNDVRSQGKKKRFNEQEMLLRIKEDCRKNLKEVGDPKVFLISSLKIEKYDFQLFADTLENEIPSNKRKALLLAWPVCTRAILERKIEMLRRFIYGAAILSGAIAPIPVPGLSVACDGAIVGAFFIKCYYAFGLDDASLERLSEKVNKPHLKYIRKSKLMSALGDKVSTRVTSSVGITALATIEYFSSLIPGVGSAVAAGLSFNTTKCILNQGLDDIANTAREIMIEIGLE